MKILFVHNNIPGQYKHLLTYYSENTEYEVACIGDASNAIQEQSFNKNIHIYNYKMPSKIIGHKHPYISNFEVQVLRGQHTACKADEVKKNGFKPDVICVHPGWGEGLYLRDVFPDAKILTFCEFYYNSKNADVDFELEKPLPLEKLQQIRTKNAAQLISIAAGDWGVSPTNWQKNQYPEIIRKRIIVIHDGIDTDIAKPNKDAYIVMSRAGKIKADDEIITFVSRNLEPYRGFHIFVQALPLIQKKRPKARIIIVGGNERGYGSAPPSKTTYRDLFMSRVKDKVDMSRIYFLGRIPYTQLINLLQISAAHVYLTYPFVLSWSMLEAMACGCAVIGSRTQPVEEVIEHGKNGILVDFFSPEEIAEAVDDVLTNKEKKNSLGKAAREAILQKYDLKKICLPAQIKLIDDLAHNSRDYILEQPYF